MVRMLLATGTTLGVLALGYWAATPAPTVASREPSSALCGCGMPSEVLDLCLTNPAEPETPPDDIVEVLDLAGSAYAEPQRLPGLVLESRPEATNIVAVGGVPEGPPGAEEVLPFPESTRVGATPVGVLRDRLARGFVEWVSGICVLPGSATPPGVAAPAPPQAK